MVVGEGSDWVKGESVLGEKGKEESVSVRMKMASWNDVGSEEGEKLKREEEASRKSVVNELPH